MYIVCDIYMYAHSKKKKKWKVKVKNILKQANGYGIPTNGSTLSPNTAWPTLFARQLTWVIATEVVESLVAVALFVYTQYYYEGSSKCMHRFRT